MEESDISNQQLCVCDLCEDFIGHQSLYHAAAGTEGHYVGRQFASRKFIENDGKPFTTGDWCVKS